MIKLKTKKRLFRKDEFKIVDYNVKDLYSKVDDLNDLKETYKNLTLTCDGGGILGIIPALNLYILENKLNSDNKNKHILLNEYFKTIFGTSTGAIISGLVAIGTPAKEILRLYVEKAPKMFDVQKGGAINIFSKATYDSDYIGSILVEYFGYTTFSDIKERGLDLNITVADPISRQTVFCNFNNTPKMRISDAIHASMSAPTYFGPYKFFGIFDKETPQNNILFDGGSGNYNCTLEKAICKALYKDKINPKDFFVYSLGCGKIKFVSETREQDIINIARFRKPKQLLWTFEFGREESIDRQVKWANYRAKDSNVNFKRIDFDLSKELVKMDKTNNIDNVLELAQKEMSK